jgi:hypothetical protein
MESKPLELDRDESLQIGKQGIQGLHLLMLPHFGCSIYPNGNRGLRNLVYSLMSIYFAYYHPFCNSATVPLGHDYQR